LKWITAKIGTHSTQRILIIKGRLRVDEVIRFSETGKLRDAQGGLVRRITATHVFIERF